MRSHNPAEDIKPLPEKAPPQPPAPKPIPGRPGWVMDKGVERYIEPPRPKTVALAPADADAIQRAGAAASGRVGFDAVYALLCTFTTHGGGGYRNVDPARAAECIKAFEGLGVRHGCVVPNRCTFGCCGQCDRVGAPA